jgi:tripartite-type tricarboxylate transporter receptor subunit TctC
MTFNFPATSIEFIKAGRLIPLMQTGRKRLAILPDVPTAIEVGLPGAALAPWGGIWAPAKISHERAQWLNTQFRRVLESEDYSRYMQSSGSEPHSNSLSEFAAFFESERVKWTDLIKKTGVKLE